MTGVAGSGRAARSGSRQPVRLTELPLGEPGAGGRRGSVRSAADAYRPVRLGMRTANVACQRRAKRRFLARLDIQACITERDRPDMREASLPNTGGGELASRANDLARIICLWAALCAVAVGLARCDPRRQGASGRAAPAWRAVGSCLRPERWASRPGVYHKRCVPLRQDIRR